MFLISGRIFVLACEPHEQIHENLYANKMKSKGPKRDPQKNTIKT